jgi:hypothetical protein
VPRGARIILIVFGVFVFLAISALLARALTATGVERAAVLDLVRAQARGAEGTVLQQLPACAAEPACAAATRERTRRVRRPGEVRLLRFEPSVGLTLTRQSGIARVAWNAGGGRPVVQCVRVRREGPLTGGGVELLSISAPIGGEASCGRGRPAA